MMQNEPVAIISVVIALIEAGIVMAVGFGLDWSTEQIAAVMGVVIALGAVVQTLLTRARVTPFHKIPSVSWQEEDE